jgi:glycosyltransferase involved in cell wall biosynthesis
MDCRKKVLHLVLNRFVNDSRVLKECRSLSEHGYDVTVFALFEPGLAREENDSFLHLYRFSLTTKSWSRRKPIQFIKYGECLIRMAAKAHALHPEVIHAHDLSALPIARFVAQRLKVPVIYDAHEFETEQWENPNRLLHGFLVRLERYLIKRVSGVITVSEGIACEYSQRYAIPRPRLVLNCPAFRSVEKANLFCNSLSISPQQKIFLYQGNLSPGRGVETLLDAFSGTPRGDAVLLFMGHGPLENSIRQTMTKSLNVFLHPAVPSGELLRYTASADIGICNIQNTCLSFYHCLPNKFFEYATAGLPILVSNLPEMSKIVTEYDCGMVIEHDTPAAVRAAVDNILRADLAAYAKNARRMVERYNWEAQEKVLLSLYEEVLSPAAIAADPARGAARSPCVGKATAD